MSCTTHAWRAGRSVTSVPHGGQVGRNGSDARAARLRAVAAGAPPGGRARAGGGRCPAGGGGTEPAHQLQPPGVQHRPRPLRPHQLRLHPRWQRFDARHRQGRLAHARRPVRRDDADRHHQRLQPVRPRPRRHRRGARLRHLEDDLHALRLPEGRPADRAPVALDGEQRRRADVDLQRGRHPRRPPVVLRLGRHVRQLPHRRHGRGRARRHAVRRQRRRVELLRHRCLCPPGPGHHQPARQDLPRQPRRIGRGRQPLLPTGQPHVVAEPSVRLRAAQPVPLPAPARHRHALPRRRRVGLVGGARHRPWRRELRLAVRGGTARLQQRLPGLPHVRDRPQRRRDHPARVHMASRRRQRGGGRRLLSGRQLPGLVYRVVLLRRLRRRTGLRPVTGRPDDVVRNRGRRADRPPRRSGRRHLLLRPHVVEDLPAPVLGRPQPVPDGGGRLERHGRAAASRRRLQRQRLVRPRRRRDGDLDLRVGLRRRRHRDRQDGQPHVHPGRHVHGQAHRHGRARRQRLRHDLDLHHQRATAAHRRPAAGGRHLRGRRRRADRGPRHRPGRPDAEHHLPAGHPPLPRARELPPAPERRPGRAAGLVHLRDPRPRRRLLPRGHRHRGGRRRCDGDVVGHHPGP